MLNDELPDDIYALVEKHSEEGNILIHSGDDQGAIGEWKKALDLIPSPKFLWDAAWWIHASIGEAKRNLNQIEDALGEFQTAYRCAGGAQNAFVLYGVGACLFDLNQKEECTEYLLRAYMLEGEILFEDENSKYLEYLKHKGYA